MSKINKIIILPAFLLIAVGVNAGDCFKSQKQAAVYEQGLSVPTENEAITNCLKAEIVKENPKTLQASMQALKNSANLPAVLPQVVSIFMSSPLPQNSFAAATAMAAFPADLLNYQQKFLDVLSSPTLPDYKKTLAVVILTSMDALDAQYSPFLNPALEADDAALRAYSAGAYSILIPGTQAKYINQIIQLYTFDKLFAQKAYNATLLKSKALDGYLKAALKSTDGQLRIAAIEWMADLETKKAALALLDIPQSYNDTQTLSAAANGLVKNYTLVEAELKKTLKDAPATTKATIAVLVYAFMGSRSDAITDTMLKKGNTNEKVNAIRIVSSITAILNDKPHAFTNPELEKLRLKKYIPLIGQLAKNGNAETQTYADNALKEMYRLLNK